MKKMIVLGALALAPMFVMAAAEKPCTGTAGLAVADVTGNTDGSKFVRTTFKPQCSANTLVTVDQSATALWGGSGSKKGKSAFLGSTNGGAVKPNASCAAAGCSDTEVDAAVTAAALIGAS